jgi:anion-transporting  ArsA/GET3 family ATPase
VLLTGKVYEAARRRSGDRFTYDAVIMDAPPTGRITRFLNVNSEVAGLAKVGPIRRQADSIMQMMRAPETRVHLVTVLEEMPVQETIDGIAELTSERLPVGHVILNLVRPSVLSDDSQHALAAGSVEPSAVASVLAGAGLERDVDVAEALIAGGEAHLERQRLQDAQREILDGCGRPLVELPLLSDGIDLGALFELAEQLGDLR